MRRECTDQRLGLAPTAKNGGIGRNHVQRDIKHVPGELRPGRARVSVQPLALMEQDKALSHVTCAGLVMLCQCPGNGALEFLFATRCDHRPAIAFHRHAGEGLDLQQALELATLGGLTGGVDHVEGGPARDQLLAAIGIIGEPAGIR